MPPWLCPPWYNYDKYCVDTPTLLKLTTMKGANGKPLKIIMEISAKDYMTFGMCLLQDENGAAVDVLKKDHIQEGAKNVTRAILQQWLTSTAAPRTYQHLIDSLKLTDGLDGLAELIEKTFEQGMQILSLASLFLKMCTVFLVKKIWMPLHIVLHVAH